MTYALAALKPKRRKLPAPPPSLVPHPCVVLAVDPGKAAGWSIWYRDRLVDFGECSGLDYDACKAVVSAALLVAQLASLPTVLVLEKPPTHHALRSFKSMLGTGENRGAWKLAWKALKQPDRRRVLAPIPAWRGAVLGREFAGSVDRGRVRAQEQRVATSLVQRHYRGAIKPVGPDAAPAIGIGRWAARAGEVGAALAPRPKNGRG
jgi:hypothetical protein